MAIEKKAGCEPLRGYRLLEPLGRGGYGEVWKCEAPGGIHKAIKFVYGNLGSLDGAARQAEDELKAVQRIKSIRHPFLLSMDRVESVEGELVIVTELADQNLHELLEKCQSQGLPGVPRVELLAYLREAAEVLDLLNLKFKLQHLDVKPRNLFLVSNHVKVADFGLVSSLSGAGHGHLPDRMGAITPLYAAPEVFLGKLSRFSDQYSLAIAFQELLTGELPFDGKNPRQLLLKHTQEAPNLSSVSPVDQAVLARALAKDPNQRFSSCLELIRALQGDAKPLLSIQSSPDAPKQNRETRPASMADTVRPTSNRMPILPDEVLPDYRFVESMGNTPLLELWKVQGPEESERLLKFVFGFASKDEQTRKIKIARFRSIQHPGLLHNEVVLAEPGRLVLLSDLPRETLRDRFRKCVGQKLPGIPRAELLDYLRAAAEVLDYLYRQHGVQHLALSPRQLSLDKGWLQISDFGLAQMFWQPSGQDLARLHPRYAAPELFERRATTACDQFSLALIYAELLTGVIPFAGPTTNRREVANLDGLPPDDRAVIARALSTDPKKRWGSCIEMVMNLEGIKEEQELEANKHADHFALMIKQSKPSRQAARGANANVDLHRVLAALIAGVGGEEAARELQDVPSMSPSGDALTHTFQVGLPLGTARRKLQNFPSQWNGAATSETELEISFQVPLPANLWDRVWGRDAGITVDVALERVHPLSPTPIEVRFAVQVYGTQRKRGIHLLERIGPAILDGLRQFLMVSAEKRTQERFLWPHEVTVIPLDADGRPQDPVVCRGKDISPGGIGVYLPHELNTVDVLLELPNPVDGGTVQVPGSLVRAKACADGWYDVGVLFRLSAVRRSQAEVRLPAHA